MRYEVSFGSLNAKPRARAPGTKFRLALLGDFSGRANSGQLETGEALARRKPIKVDVDTLDHVIGRMKITLSLALDGEAGVVSVPIGEMEDFHPDQIVDKVELFEQLRDLRRNLGSRAGGPYAAAQPPRRVSGSSAWNVRRAGRYEGR